MAKPGTASYSLIELLERERQLLLEGRLGELPELTEAKMAALEVLRTAESKINERDIEEIRAVASSNCRLMESAKRGVMSIRRRMEELQRVAKGTQTYGSDGRRTLLDATRPNQDKSF